VGVALIGITILFALYAAWKYRIRLNGIGRDSSIQFGDRWGPPVLIALFALVLTFLALWFTVIERSVTPAPAPSSE
jgi:uncharacterized membrane protein YfbV (UPF0208 family)